MESECISNNALLASTTECMKLIEIVMKGIRIEEGEEYSLSPNEKWVLVRERIRVLIMELAVYLHPRKSFEEINIVRNRESALACPPCPPSPPPPPPPPPTDVIPLELSPPEMSPPLVTPIELPTITVSLMPPMPPMPLMHPTSSIPDSPTPILKRDLIPSTIHCTYYGKI